MMGAFPVFAEILVTEGPGQLVIASCVTDESVKYIITVHKLCIT